LVKRKENGVYKGGCIGFGIAERRNGYIIFKKEIFKNNKNEIIMNWYRISQYDLDVADPSVDLETSDGNSGFPPIDDNDGSGGNEDFRPDWKMTNLIWGWFEKQNAPFSESIADLLIDNILDIEFHIRERPEPSYPLKGKAFARIVFLMDESNVRWSVLENEITKFVLFSDLWKEIGIDYNKASNYLNMPSFHKVVIDAGLHTSLDLASKKLEFWGFENLNKYQNIFAEKLIEQLNRYSYSNLDKSSLQLKQEPKTLSNRINYYMNLDGTHQLRSGMIQFYDFSIIPWEFKQSSDNEFTQLTSGEQKEFVDGLFDIMQYLDGSENIFNINPEFEISGKYMEGTWNYPPEYEDVIPYLIDKKKEYRINLEEDENIADFIRKYKNFSMIFKGIPENLLVYINITKEMVSPIKIESGQYDVEYNATAYIENIVLRNNELILTIGYELE